MVFLAWAQKSEFADNLLHSPSKSVCLPLLRFSKSLLGNLVLLPGWGTGGLLGFWGGWVGVLCFFFLDVYGSFLLLFLAPERQLELSGSRAVSKFSQSIIYVQRNPLCAFETFELYQK